MPGRRPKTESEALAALEDHRKTCSSCRPGPGGADLDAMCQRGLALLLAFLNAP